MDSIKDFCLICKNINFKYLFSSKDYRFQTNENEFHLYSCTKCKLIKSFPNLSKIEIDKYYPKIDYYQNIINNISHKILNKNKKFDKYIKNINSLTNLKNPKVLDYGCGDMSLVKYLSYKNFDISGYEVNQSIKKIKDFKIFENQIFFDIEKIIKSKKKFDVIILNHVFEHLEDPLEFIQNIKKIINNNAFIIIEVPNSECLQIKLFKEYAIHLDQPRHRYIYNKKNLSKLFVENGFSKVIENDGFNKHLDYPLSFFRSFISFFNNYEKSKIYKTYITFLLPFLFITYIFKKNSHQSIGVIFNSNNCE